MKTKLFLFVLLSTSILQAQDCRQGWAYFLPVTIHNPSAEHLTDVQVSFELNADELIRDGKLRANAADLRVLDEHCNPVQYYMNMSFTDSIKSVWVKLPSLPANDSVKLQVYYGHPRATPAANGDQTFLFFDDFESGSLNTDKWEAIGGYTSIQVADGILEYSSNGSHPDGSRFKFIRSAMSFSEKVNIDYRAKISNSNGIGFSSADTLIHRLMIRQNVGNYGFDTLSQIAYMRDTMDNGYQVNGMYPVVRFPRHEYWDATLQVGIQNDTLTFYRYEDLVDGSVSDTIYQLLEEQMSGFHFMISSFLGSQTIYLDHIQIRKPIPASIRYTTGEEEMLVVSSNEDLLPSWNLEISPNPGTDHVQIGGLPTGSFDIRLFNVQGQTLIQENIRMIEGQKYRLDLPTMPEGLYWISVMDDEGLRNSKSMLIQDK
ncbi:MAG: DUF2341 domain-containing protein [Bacteroidota bacterium]